MHIDFLNYENIFSMAKGNEEATLTLPGELESKVREIHHSVFGSNGEDPPTFHQMKNFLFDVKSHMISRKLERAKDDNEISEIYQEYLQLVRFKMSSLGNIQGKGEAVRLKPLKLEVEG